MDFSEYSFETILEKLFNSVQESCKNLSQLNIIVAGKTGVGKSTLINAVFREDLAETGIGTPVTQSMKKYSKSDFPLVIYDTKGFELDESVQKEVKASILSLISDKLSENDISKAIHCIWYCINTASNRIDPKEIEWLNSICDESKLTNVPVIVILTQSFSKKNAADMQRVLESYNLNVTQIIPVLAQDYEFDEDNPPIRAYGLDKLADVMNDVLPEKIQDTFINVQKCSLKMKVERANKYIITAASAAAAAGATPIPFSDAVILVPIQITMLSGITKSFGFHITKAILSTILAGTIGTVGATVLGKTIVSNVLKFIPGVGSVAGAVISGGTAAAITTALGKAYISILSKVYKGEMELNELETEAGKEAIRKAFEEHLKNSENRSDN